MSESVNVTAYTQRLRKHADWMEAHWRDLRNANRLAGLGGGCDPVDEPPTTGVPEAWLIHCRINYLSELIDCLKKPAGEQAACCEEAKLTYFFCCTHPPVGSGGG